MKKEFIPKILKFIVFYVLIMIIIYYAWLCDDAYISFRVIKNFINGYGLRWNIIERVQVFTNPLMVLSLIPIYAITHEIYYTSIIFNIIVSSLAIYLLLFKISKNDWMSILIAIFLIGSKSFISFTTSGLENCFTFLLLAIFYYLFFKKEIYEKKDILILSFVASLILLNRMDSILLVFPSLIYVFINRNKDIKVSTFLLYFIIGMIPFIIWETFSLIYYGFLFPNTYYAKMTTGISKKNYIINGITYIGTIILMDPATIIIIFFGMLLIFIKPEKKELYLIAGTILSIIYIIYVGGDFMLGRFLTPALFTTLICFTRLKKDYFGERTFKFVIVIAIVSYITAYINYQKNIADLTFHDTNGVADEREFYIYCTGLFKIYPTKKEVMANYFQKTKYAENVYVAGNIGFMGYYADDKDTIIDIYALSDPFLARVPINTTTMERVGHNTRDIPPGYIPTVIENKNEIMDDNLKKYYDAIKVITQDPIFSMKRIKTVIKFNLGKYNYLIDNYMKKQKG